MSFYSDAAQVIPLLLLAIVWEAGYLDRLRRATWSERKFWSATAIRAWCSVLLPAAIAAEAIALLTVADRLDAATWSEVFTLVSLAALLLTLLVRMLSDIYEATSRTDAAGPSVVSAASRSSRAGGADPRTTDGRELDEPED